MKKTILVLAIFILTTVPILERFVYPVDAADSVTLVISELMPNPIGDDTKLEWIEIQNRSDFEVNLAGWKLNTVALPEFVIESGEIILLVRDKTAFGQSFQTSARVLETSFNLLNSGNTVTLENTTNGYVNAFAYPNSVEGKSFERLEGNCNTISMHSQSHSVGMSNTSCISTPAPSVTLTPTAVYHTAANKNIKITKLNPYPISGDEFVELTNTGSTQVNLEGWSISDLSNKTFKLQNIVLNANESKIIYPSNISLNNDGDTVRLLDATGQTIDSVSYGKISKGEIVSFLNSSSSMGDDGLANNAEDIEGTSIVKSISIKTDAHKNNKKYFKKPIYYKVGEYVLSE